MWRYNNICEIDELSHHGILGQKWGVRRFQDAKGRLSNAGKKRYSDAVTNEKNYRKKLKAISNNKTLDEHSKQLVDYRNQSLGKRISKTAARTAAGFVAQKVFSSVILGKPILPKNRAQFTKDIISLSIKTTAKVAYKDALAKSVSKRYTQKGKRLKGTGKNDPLITKEQRIEAATNFGIRLAQVGLFIADYKYRSANQNRKNNEEIFNKWGQNILPEKVDHVVWQNDDNTMAVIDNRY